MYPRRFVVKSLTLGIAGGMVPFSGLLRAGQTPAPGPHPGGQALPEGGAGTAGTALPATTDVPQAPAPWPLLQPLVGGAVLGLGWRIEDLSPVTKGAAVLVLRNGERTARVHICRHDGSPVGVAHTAHLDLVVMNGGKGGSQTDESLGRVLLGLAPHLAANESRVDLALLQTHPERMRAHAAGGGLA